MHRTCFATPSVLQRIGALLPEPWILLIVGLAAVALWRVIASVLFQQGRRLAYEVEGLV